MVMRGVVVVLASIMLIITYWIIVRGWTKFAICSIIYAFIFNGDGND